ncbi:MAG: hypothetical protein ACE5G7_06605 [Candidatus Hydrothermarchaeaceae archaeon]
MRTDTFAIASMLALAIIAGCLGGGHPKRLCPLRLKKKLRHQISP